MATDTYRKLLELQQFADSAVPIGGAAHSFGLETLVEAGLLGLENLDDFLRDYLDEAGVLEPCYCAQAVSLAEPAVSWLHPSPVAVASNSNAAAR